jgi:hypothetical protein
MGNHYVGGQSAASSSQQSSHSGHQTHHHLLNSQQHSAHATRGIGNIHGSGGGLGSAGTSGGASSGAPTGMNGSLLNTTVASASDRDHHSGSNVPTTIAGLNSTGPNSVVPSTSGNSNAGSTP